MANLAFGGQAWFWIKFNCNLVLVVFVLTDENTDTTSLEQGAKWTQPTCGIWHVCPVYMEGERSWPSTWKILEGEATFRLAYIQKFRLEWLPRGERKVEKLSAFSSWTCRRRNVFFFRSLVIKIGRTFRAKAFYVGLGSSARKILSLERS